jgi:hypothetical protein
VRPKGLVKLKKKINLPHRVLNPRPWGLYHSAISQCSLSLGRSRWDTALCPVPAEDKEHTLSYKGPVDLGYLCQTRRSSRQWPLRFMLKRSEKVFIAHWGPKHSHKRTRRWNKVSYVICSHSGREVMTLPSSKAKLTDPEQIPQVWRSSSHGQTFGQSIIKITHWDPPPTAIAHAAA